MLTGLICGFGLGPEFELAFAFCSLVKSRIWPRFQTDPNHGATEKLTVCLLPPRVYDRRPLIPASEVCSDSSLLDPLSLLFVKGWSRSFCAVLVMLAAFEIKELYEATANLVFLACWCFCLSVRGGAGHASRLQGDWLSGLALSSNPIP